MCTNVVTEMSSDRNGQTEMSRDRNGPRPKWPDRNDQTEMTRPKSRVPGEDSWKSQSNFGFPVKAAKTNRVTTLWHGFIKNLQ